MGTVKVVCGVICRDGKVLLCRRMPHKSLAGYWEFPGGKVEQGEGEREALTRELVEELGMRVIVGDRLQPVRHSYEKTQIELTAYFCEFESATFTMVDHDALEWVPYAELGKWNLAPADIPIAEQVIENWPL